MLHLTTKNIANFTTAAIAIAVCRLNNYGTTASFAIILGNLLAVQALEKYNPRLFGNNVNHRLENPGTTGQNNGFVILNPNPPVEPINWTGLAV